MKRGLFIILAIISLIVISNVIAYQSTITVKTGLPNKDIIFRACDPDNGTTLSGGEFREKADSSGKVVFDYDLEPIRIKMSFMAWNGNSYSLFLNGKEAVFIPNVILDEFVDVNLNQANASVNAYSNKTKEEPKAEKIIENATKEINETIEAETNSEPGIKKESKLTGFVITQGKSLFTSKITYYILGILVLVLVIGFVFKNKLMNLHLPEFKHEHEGKKSEFKVLPRENPKLRDAERKLEQVKKELDEIRNRNSSLQEARKRLEADRRELERLERD